MYSKTILILTVALGLGSTNRCYKAKFEFNKETTNKVVMTDIPGSKTIVPETEHMQYKVQMHYRLCDPVGPDDPCIATQVKEAEVQEKELEEAYSNGKCLVGKECLSDACYDERVYRCTGMVRDRWVTDKRPSILRKYTTALRWACQTTWDCTHRLFKTNVQLLSLNPLTYRLETPHGRFVECSSLRPYVVDPLGYYITCPKIEAYSVPEKFHCIKHPERILCRAQSDHALVDFSKDLDQVIDNVLYSITNDSHAEIKKETNKLASGTIADSEKMMREVEMNNLQLILDISILKERINSLTNLMVRTIAKVSAADPTLLGSIIGDNTITEQLRNGVFYYQCARERNESCGCLKELDGRMACRSEVACTAKEEGSYLSIMPQFSNASLSLELTQHIAFRERIKDLWINDIHYDAKQKEKSKSDQEKGSWGWFDPVERFLTGVWHYIMNSILTVTSLCLSIYSIKLHLYRRVKS